MHSFVEKLIKSPHSFKVNEKLKLSSTVKLNNLNHTSSPINNTRSIFTPSKLSPLSFHDNLTSKAPLNPRSKSSKQFQHKVIAPNIDLLKTLGPLRYSNKRNAEIEAYAAITHEGLIRDYNEDRVSIILNAVKPNNKRVYKWQKICFFAVYDDHGGSKCANYLRDDIFPEDPSSAIQNIFRRIEEEFLKITEAGDKIKRSGSCALICLIIGTFNTQSHTGQKVYIVNTGDSRATISINNGKAVKALTT